MKTYGIQCESIPDGDVRTEALEFSFDTNLVPFASTSIPAVVYLDCSRRESISVISRVCGVCVPSRRRSFSYVNLPSITD